MKPMESQSSRLNEALQAMDDDCFFASGLLCYKSADVSAQVIAMIRACEELADLLKRTDSQLFNFTKCAKGTTLGKRHEKWPLFYELERSRTKISSNLQPAEDLLAVRSTWKAVIPEHLQFTGNVQAQICGNDVLEGELINTYTSRCREKLRSKRHREQLSARKQGIANLVAKSRRHVGRLLQVFPNARVTRFDVGFQMGEKRAHDLKTADHLLREFIRELMTNAELERPLSYLYKREYLTEIGYRHHFVTFNEHGSTRASVASKGVADTWRKVAGERCSFFDYAQFPNSYRSWGIGPLSHHSEALMEGLRQMVQRDFYLRVTPDDRYPSFGMGELPKLPKCPPVRLVGTRELTSMFSAFAR